MILHAYDLHVETCDAIVLGEFLREQAFGGVGFGCYETFEVKPWIKTQMSRAHIKWLLDYVYGPELMQTLDADGIAVRGHIGRLGDCWVEMIYFWEGDGDLTFRIGEQIAGSALAGSERFICNDDCKKTYSWSDVTPVGSLVCISDDDD